MTTVCQQKRQVEGEGVKVVSTFTIQAVRFVSPLCGLRTYSGLIIVIYSLRASYYYDEHCI